MVKLTVETKQKRFMLGAQYDKFMPVKLIIGFGWLELWFWEM